jgi:hypothetical protein
MAAASASSSAVNATQPRPRPQLQLEQQHTPHLHLQAQKRPAPWAAAHLLLTLHILIRGLRGLGDVVELVVGGLRRIRIPIRRGIHDSMIWDWSWSCTRGMGNECGLGWNFPLPGTSYTRFEFCLGIMIYTSLDCLLATALSFGSFFLLFFLFLYILICFCLLLSLEENHAF